MKRKYLNKFMIPVHGYVYRGVPILLEASRIQLHWSWFIGEDWYGNNVELASDERLKTIGDWFGRIHPNGSKPTVASARRCWEKDVWGIKSSTEQCINILLKNKKK